MSVSSTVTAPRIIAVVVLYHTTPAGSAVFQSLQESLRHVSPGNLKLKILLYDNTPGGCDPGPLAEGVQYESVKQNAGLANAYNRALSIAQREKYTWLLTLDQDTKLPFDYLSRISKLALNIESDNSVAAIVPQLSDAGRLLSPVFVRFWGASYLRHSFSGIARRETHAFNSASLFRVSALRQIGNFNPYFWLDHQDAYVYRQLHLHGRKVYVAGDIHVEHELSLLHGENLNADRFWNFLKAESAFCDLYGGRIEGLALTGRLLGRIWRQRRRGQTIAIRQLTWNALKRRVLQSKMSRIQDWKNEMEQRMLCAQDKGKDREPSEERQAISVCMAAYNGERYVTAQLQSILSQLGEGDEVIVVDDASTDATRDCVLGLQDDRIRLIVHPSNLGVSRTFEDAIRGASGRILFLSDQDDLWMPQKVAVVLEAFRSHPNVTLITTDGVVLDSNGAQLSETFYTGGRKFRSGFWANLFRNRFGGCTMAFRAELIGDILPFSHRYDVLHDIWIGVRNSLSGRRTLYIQEPLVLNRRHPSTATGREPLTMARKVRNRLDLLLALAEFWIRRIKL
jgi:glycosyltransferase involved in cell wall biosynthesis